MIEGYGAPDINTPGNVGSFYRDLETNTMYKCTDMISEPVQKQFVSIRSHVPTTKYEWEGPTPIHFPDDGKTRFLMEIVEGLLESVLTFTLSGDLAGTIDWGDGKIASLASINRHTYRKAGEYVVTINVTNGRIQINQDFAKHHYTADFGYSQVKRCVVGEQVTLGDRCFSNLPNLQTVALKTSDLRAIPQYAFSECKSLRSIEMPNITTIYKYAFQNCSSLNIEIPNSIEYMGDSAFTGCASITNIEIPNGHMVISNNLLSSCCSLKNVSIPESVTTIQNMALAGTYALESVTFPSTVTEIGEAALYQSAVKAIYVKSSTPPTLKKHVGLGWPLPSGIPIYVPSISVSEYQSATGWSTYANQILPMSALD